MTARTGHWALVAFTSLAIAGAGVVAASARFELLYGLDSGRMVAAGAGSARRRTARVARPPGPEAAAGWPFAVPDGAR